MKQKFLHQIIFLLTLGLALPTFAQITLTADNFPRAKEFVDSIYVSTPSSPAIPSSGPDQVWDYSGLQLDGIVAIEHYDASDYPQFPNVLNVRIADLIFQGFLIFSDSFEAIDSEGWYDVGRRTYDASYSITALTGGPNDTLSFPGTDEIFGGRLNYVPFPMNYEDQWTQSRIENIPFELTVAAFGLDKTPGTRQRTVTHNREVV